MQHYDALVSFIETIEACGGLVHNDDGELVPIGADDWPDLATEYITACLATGRKPMIDWSNRPEG